ncbi:metallophosphoesterase [Natrinema altunense]|uniref:Metallophosphoesterase n=1 Tax=Natrinema altunense (strain JCM 12890 / CGMCC 1.3731 / AJ2) TaxID=1227494 RepID=L9ZYJ8_NATA2|nr:metallophosphoesterase [Natrinema altunense]ELY91156.1 metallophosphoesterase [Natrinema altunense JCM 12890]
MTDDIAVDLPISIHDRAAFVPAAETLVVADIHLGKAAASSVEAPIDDGRDAVERLRGLLAETEPATVVIAGDLLHSFSRLPRGVERDLERLVETVEAAGAELVVTPGNHDTLLEDVFSGTTVEEYRLADGDTVVCHGHERPDATADRYVVGHDHPALSIEGRKLPCFLYGPACDEEADVLVLPAFTRLAAGTTVNGLSGRDFQTPLVQSPDAFHPAVRDDSSGDVLWFPPLGELRRML